VRDLGERQSDREDWFLRCFQERDQGIARGPGVYGLSQDVGRLGKRATVSIVASLQARGKGAGCQPAAGWQEVAEKLD